MEGKAFCVLSLVLVLLKGCLCIPPPVPDFDDEWPEEVTNGSVIVKVLNETRMRRLSLKSRYVYHKGAITTSDGGGYRIRVDATYSVPDSALNIAACTAKKMTQRMPSDIFNRLASSAKIGIFSKSETLTIYPEYANVRNPADCGTTNCAGHCQHSCTFDGRKYYTLAGAGGRRTAILSDNILCNSADPYHSTNNILVHEFSHTVKNYGLSSAERSQVNSAYNHAKSARLWADYYPMATVEEYFAVGSAVYFNADHQRYRGTGNHMDLCSGSNFCTSEYQSRTHLYQIDNPLYNLLTHVYDNNKVGNYANIGVCGSTC
ncbi:uncharacterized protein LOC132741944 [Ruditapes philippinarum]|uniref:uncharacterized protein LOC132741944 n=1 Tax=Ruditapes philippinarum TaxID=129788 RepID=UPI00295B5405|nr:uncharacterized protein LOC132741944 [Ruditapes philippinarum]